MSDKETHARAADDTGADDLTFERAVIFGATGAIGPVIAEALLKRGVHVRAVARSAEHLARDFASTPFERCVADVGVEAEAMRAAKDCDLIVHAVGLPLSSYEQHASMGRTTAKVMCATGASCLLVSGYWSVAPIGDSPVNKRHPRPGATPLTRARVEQEDCLCDAGAVVAILPDFYGPGARKSVLNEGLGALVRGGRVKWPGRCDAPREFIYVPDAGETLAALVTRRDAQGKRWIVPGAGPVSPRAVIEKAASKLGVRSRITSDTRWRIALRSLLSAGARQGAVLFPIYNRPVSFDGAALNALLGAGGVGAESRVTPYDAGVAATLRWLDEEDRRHNEH